MAVLFVRDILLVTFGLILVAARVMLASFVDAISLEVILDRKSVV